VLAPERLHALLLNGGGRRQLNYYSHLDHLVQAVRLLEAADVPSDRIAVFSADGEDPAPDLATREGDGDGGDWLLPRAVARSLRPVDFVDSRIEGVTLRPATRSALERWFFEEGSHLEAGDVLLLYVTDHGKKGRETPIDNTIMLWGGSLDVEELRALLLLLDPAVRIVLVMSQCYSGGFAHLILPGAAEAPGLANVCGYFSTTAARRAHGCYPEVSGKPAVGHSHRLFEALARGQGLAQAQQEVLVTDSTPDVPNSTRGLFLETQLRAAADGSGVSLSLLADARLAEALADPLDWEPELRLLDRVAAAYGFASPRSLAALDGQVGELEALSERLATIAGLWKRALDALRKENLGTLQERDPAWRERLVPAALRQLSAGERSRVRDELVAALEETAAEEGDRLRRMRELHQKAEASRGARYRAEVRLGVVLRMRALLLEIAGRHQLAQAGEAETRAIYERLEACEDLALAPAPTKPEEPPETEPFPTLAEERRELARIVPGWLGIRYRPPRAAERRRHTLPPGAAVVSAVLPETPADDAGLQVGDVLLGTPDAPFTEAHGIREWTMLGEVDKSHPLRVLRQGEEREVWVRLAAYPLEVPALPGPPALGTIAPPLEAEPLDGAPLPAAHEPRLLFFWATWCRHCKAALPEVEAFARSRQVPIVAITDESRDDVERFLAARPAAAPLRVALDPLRRSFERYGVSGTPTFVWIDPGGGIRHYQRGYSAERGLTIDGWRYPEPGVP
jgi:thiol-disulfide isomerase/thioredoxin